MSTPGRSPFAITPAIPELLYELFEFRLLIVSEDLSDFRVGLISDGVVLRTKLNGQRFVAFPTLADDFLQLFLLALVQIERAAHILRYVVRGSRRPLNGHRRNIPAIERICQPSRNAPENENTN